MSKIEPVIIVGTGPAGLMAARVISPLYPVFMLDAGGPVETREASRDIPSEAGKGAGGAAIVNDGKFTFGLAGSATKKLPRVEEALRMVAELLGEPFDHALIEGSSERADNGFTLKQSKSVRRTLAERLALTARLVNDIKGTILYYARVTKLEGRTITYVHDGVEHTLTGRAVILATGRFGPRSMHTDLPTVFRRFEYGIRIECDIGRGILGELYDQCGCDDPKWTKSFTIDYEDDSVPCEVRTFCWCSNGKAVLIEGFEKELAWSGVSDGPPTGRINVGLMVRVRVDPGEDYICPLFAETTRFTELAERAAAHTTGFWAKALQAGISEFLALGTNDDTVYTIQGPCLEGFGEYPQLQPNSVLVGDNVYACGDYSGAFRGLVPAMVSGVDAAHHFLKQLQYQTRMNMYKCIEKPLVELPGDVSGTVRLYEIHCFLGPFNPSEAEIARYEALVDAYNSLMIPLSDTSFKKMKPPVLSLKIGDTYVRVMQSARYVNTYARAVREAADMDAAYFKSYGFEVLRVKIEMAAYHASIGATAAEAMDIYNQHGVYFESHIRLIAKTVPGEEEIHELEAAALELQSTFMIPIAVSYNKRRVVDGVVTGQQRYLNVRFRGIPTHAIQRKLHAIKAAVALLKYWKLNASIDEYVVMDTYPAMDAGWIDPARPLVIVISGKRYSGKNTIANYLADFIAEKGILVTQASSALKKEFCMRMGVTMDDLIANRDKYAIGLKAFYLAEQPHKYTNLIVDHIKTVKTGVCIVADGRRTDTLTEIKALPVRVATLRVDCDHREERGWVPGGIDESINEVELDDYPFDYRVKSNGTLPELHATLNKIVTDLFCTV